MGDRSVIGFQMDNTLKATYSHWESSPKKTGREITNVLLQLKSEHLKQLKLFTKNITWVPAKSQPSSALITRHKKFSNTSVATRKLANWYCLLYKTQGIRTLLYVISGKLQYLINNTSFLKDSLFCEAGYIINFDDATLDIYVGSQRSPHDNGAFKQEITHHTDGKDYYPCKRVLQLDITAPLNNPEGEMMICADEQA